MDLLYYFQHIRNHLNKLFNTYLIIYPTIEQDCQPLQRTTKTTTATIVTMFCLLIGSAECQKRLLSLQFLDGSLPLCRKILPKVWFHFQGLAPSAYLMGALELIQGFFDLSYWCSYCWPFSIAYHCTIRVSDSPFHWRVRWVAVWYASIDVIPIVFDCPKNGFRVVFWSTCSFADIV